MNWKKSIEAMAIQRIEILLLDSFMKQWVKTSYDVYVFLQINTQTLLTCMFLLTCQIEYSKSYSKILRDIWKSLWESEFPPDLLKYLICKKYPLISMLRYWMIINNVNVINWKFSFSVKEVIQFLIIISLTWTNKAISSRRSRYQFKYYHKVSHLFH